MKIVLLIVCTMILFEPTYAQEKDLKRVYTEITSAINSALLTRQSSIEISGSVSYDYEKTSYTYDEIREIQTVQIEPVIAYFVVDNLSLGMTFLYIYEHFDVQEARVSWSIEDMFIGPAVKYYFGNKPIRPFAVADFLFLSGDKYKGTQLRMGAGVLYHLTGNIGLHLEAKYGKIWSRQNGIDYREGLQIGIGISGFIL